MAEWVYVENNKIKEYHGSLPKSWRNISGLDKANMTFLNDVGWFQVEKNHASYDENLYKSDGYEYQISSNRVVETIKLIRLTDQEINERIQRKREEFYSYLRQERNRRLLNSDWTQVFDLQSIKSSQWIDAWKTYRQNLRDLPSKYENEQNYNTSTIDWPQEPNNV